MFGYVRPLKAHLLMKEFTRYRAVYCGVCKALSDRYGQVPRLSLTYDFTFFALLFLSLSDQEVRLSKEGCVLNPIQKKPVARDHGILDLTADCTVLLAGFQLQDDVQDEGGVKASLRSFLFSGAFKKAKARLPELSSEIESLLSTLQKDEADKRGSATKEDLSPESLASHFAAVLAAMFRYAALAENVSPDLVAALQLVGADLGAWIYLIDAIDDFNEDKEKRRFNALAGDNRDQAIASVLPHLLSLEAPLDRTLALLPYRRDGGIMRNIALEGLADVRQKVISGLPLGRL